MNGAGFLLFDGASHAQALAWLCQRFPEHSPWPLLRGTPYVALADIGPIVLAANAGSALHAAWQQAQDGLHDAVWLKSDMALYDLQAVLQRRLRILSPDGRAFWLRLADARPLRNAWRAGAQWPCGFWFGVHEVWLLDSGMPLRTWCNPEPQQDLAVASQNLAAPITLDWPLLEALAQGECHTQEART